MLIITPELGLEAAVTLPTWNVGCELHAQLLRCLLLPVALVTGCSSPGKVSPGAPVSKRLVFGSVCSPHEWWVLFWPQVLSQLCLVSAARAAYATGKSCG